MTKKSPPTSRRKTSAPTIAEIAQALGVSPRRIHQLKTQGLDVSSIESALNWRDDHDQGDSAEQLRIERIQLVREQARNQRAAADEREGRLVPRAEVKAHFIRTASALGAFVKALEMEIPSICLGLPLERSRPAAKARIRQLQALLADGESEFWSSHPLTSKSTTTTTDIK